MTPAGTVFLPNRLSATLESSLNEKSREAGSLPADAPYLRLDTLLARLKDRYELRIDAREKIAAASVSANVACDRLSALRTDSTPSGLMWPESVEIWSAVESGVIQRLELRWSAGSLPVGPRSLVFELISERQLDDSFYTAEFQARGDKELTP